MTDTDVGRTPDGDGLSSQAIKPPSGVSPVPASIPCACQDCGLPYDAAWVEAVVPHEIWNQHLSPISNEGGLLCINCMARRAVAANLSGVPVRLTAGPFETAMPNLRESLAIMEAKLLQKLAPSYELLNELDTQLRDIRALKRKAIAMETQRAETSGSVGEADDSAAIAQSEQSQ